MLLANCLPHLIEGMAGRPFPSPFASPPGFGDSSPVVNACWGFANLAGGVLLLAYFPPTSREAWILVAAGGLSMAVLLARHFGAVRAKKLAA
jgi:hypothetical protein